MSEGLPYNIYELAEKNLRIIRSYGSDPAILAASYSTARQVGYEYMDGLFPGFSNRKPTYVYPFRGLESEYFDNLLNLDVGLLLVRPEIVHHVGPICDYLDENGFDVLYSERRIVDPAAYGIIYQDIFYKEAARPAIPSRTMVYVGSPTQLIVFRDRYNRFKKDDLSVAAGFVRDYKGKGGVSDRTIRGTVVYQEALRLGFNTLENNDLALALDPLHVYRHLLSLTGNFPHSHLPPLLRLLNYNAVSIHVPDEREIYKDLRGLIRTHKLRKFMTKLHENYKGISTYNTLWQSGKFKKPLVILIGGYCGTGKSTLANHFLSYLPYTNLLPTPIVRSTVKTIISKSVNPYLYEHTYDLYKLTVNQSQNEVVDAFKKHMEPIGKAMREIVSFAATERQNYIIEGNHVLPEFFADLKLDCIVIEIYLSVLDPIVHYKMLGGPTHNREVNEKQFETARILQDYIVDEVNKYDKPLFEPDGVYSDALSVIDARLCEEIGINKENVAETDVNSYR